MTTALWLALLALVPVGLLAGIRFWVMVLRRDTIQGSDLHMLRWCLEEQTRAWCFFYIGLGEGIDWEQAKSTVQANIARDMLRPDSHFRRGCDLTEQRFVHHHAIGPEDVVEVVEEDAAFYALQDARMRELVYRFHDERQLIGALFDHTVWDGIRIFNETLIPAIQAQPFPRDWLLRDRYLPLVSEVLQLYTIARMGTRWLSHRPMAPLPAACAQHIARHVFAKEEVRELKTRAGTKFTPALLAHWCMRLFAAVPGKRRRLRVGLVVALENPRFRNNYSMVTIDVRRTDSPERMARSIQRQVRRRAIEVLPLYQLLSTIEMQSLFKKSMLDVLFSPAVFERGEGPSAHVERMFLSVGATSTPVYCFSCTVGETVTVSTTWNTLELDFAQLAEDAEELFRVEAGRGLQPLTRLDLLRQPAGRAADPTLDNCIDLEKARQRRSG